MAAYSLEGSRWNFVKLFGYPLHNIWHTFFDRIRSGHGAITSYEKQTPADFPLKSLFQQLHHRHWIDESLVSKRSGGSHLLPLSPPPPLAKVARNRKPAMVNTAIIGWVISTLFFFNSASDLLSVFDRRSRHPKRLPIFLPWFNFYCFGRVVVAWLGLPTPTMSRKIGRLIIF